jgi:hypothetical protein
MSKRAKAQYFAAVFFVAVFFTARPLFYDLNKTLEGCTRVARNSKALVRNPANECKFDT